MRFTDMLKNAMGIEDNTPETYDADGKTYTRVPGKDGSLTAPAPQQPSLSDQMQQQNQTKAKVIMPTDTGSSRG